MIFFFFFDLFIYFIYLFYQKIKKKIADRKHSKSYFFSLMKMKSGTPGMGFYAGNIKKKKEEEFIKCMSFN